MAITKNKTEFKEKLKEIGKLWDVIEKTGTENERLLSEKVKILRKHYKESQFYDNNLP